MAKRLRIVMVCWLLIGAAVLVAPGLARAQAAAPAPNLAVTQDNTGTPGGTQLQSTCSQYSKSQGGKIMGRIVPCLAQIISTKTQDFTAKMIDKLMPIVMAFITLVVALFGVKMVQGGRDLRGEGFVLLLKISLVIGMLQATPTLLVPAAFDALEEGVGIMTSVLKPDSGLITCNIDDYGDANTPLVWKQVDCALGKIFGFIRGDSTGGANMLLVSSALGMTTGFLFGGTIGVTVFFALIGLFWSMLSLVIRVAFSYLSGYLLIAMLMILSPIFMPLMLLRVTANSFERWWRGIASAILTPAVIAGYAIFALVAYDHILFSDSSLLKKIFDTSQMKNIIELSKPLCDRTATTDYSKRFEQMLGSQAANLPPDQRDAAVKSLADDLLARNPFLQNMSTTGTSGGNNACQVNIPKVDFEKLTGDPNQKTSDFFRKVFTDCLKLFIMAFLMSAGLNTVQTTISSLSGSSLGVTALRSVEFSARFTSGLQAARAQAISVYSEPVLDENGNPVAASAGATGDEFLKRTPRAVTSGLQGAVNQFTNMVGKR